MCSYSLLLSVFEFFSIHCLALSIDEKFLFSTSPSEFNMNVWNSFWEYSTIRFPIYSCSFIFKNRFDVFNFLFCFSKEDDDCFTVFLTIPEMLYLSTAVIFYQRLVMLYIPYMLYIGNVEYSFCHIHSGNVGLINTGLVVRMVFRNANSPENHLPHCILLVWLFICVHVGHALVRAEHEAECSILGTTTEAVPIFDGHFLVSHSCRSFLC